MSYPKDLFYMVSLAFIPLQLMFKVSEPLPKIPKLTSLVSRQGQKLNKLLLL